MKTVYQVLAAVLAGLAMAIVVAVCTQRQAHAAETWRGDDLQGRPASLVLSEEPCADARVIAKLREGQVKPEFIAQYKAATLDWGGRTWASCWTSLTLVDRAGNEMETVYSVDQEGDVYHGPYGIPRRLFRDDAI